jgi:hypothetical protein
MANIHSDIAIRPQAESYPFDKKGINSDAQDAAEFQRILDLPAPARAQAANPAPLREKGPSFLGFIKGLIDIINPLQHIPGVSALYRHITGDEMGPAAQLIGDTIYGGPIGGALAVADIAYKKTTGRDIGETVIASLTGGNKAEEKGTALAQNLNDKVSPAAGAEKTAAAEDIIWWNDAPGINQASKLTTTAQLQPQLFPHPKPTGTIDEGLASPSTHAPPVLHPKGVASTIALQTQEAPVDTARKAVPPELIASQMMEGLQKYAAMKSAGLAPQQAAFSALH